VVVGEEQPVAAGRLAAAQLIRGLAGDRVDRVGRQLGGDAEMAERS
jgi:hypothetical protein